MSISLLPSASIFKQPDKLLIHGEAFPNTVQLFRWFSQVASNCCISTRRQLLGQAQSNPMVAPCNKCIFHNNSLPQSTFSSIIFTISCKPAASSAVNLLILGLSISSTPMTLPSLCIGITISDAEAPSQAM